MDNFSVVFSRATGNADNYRIPSVVCTKDGTLVAACDERFFTAADNPNRIDKVVRISTDGGYSWHYLDINKVDGYIEHSNWKEQRRFAGEDNFIRIWQLKATKGRAFDDLVDELNNSWAIKDYWQNNHSF